ncbi:hypothetical protein KJ652_07465 [Patescibacteria group bacterium]|nr:hypothetical protein [Patescibacteria group bacterium]MBU1124384.1 hypothetical protein [Patescibacteria group bacterium]MBU1911200.1 hypothetical protein [Patescibacteria group bacterium]
MSDGRFKLLRESDTDAIVRDFQTGCDLKLEPDSDLDGAEVTLLMQINESMGGRAFVTGRDITAYLDRIPLEELNCDQQIIEVGAGISELLPSIVNNLGDQMPNKPIVIDPINYDHALAILTEACTTYRNDSIVGVLIDRIEEFRRRCEIFMSDKIDHLRMTLRDAVDSMHPKVFGRADVVIELFGPSYHPDIDFGHDASPCDMETLLTIMKMRRKLLKDPTTGIDISNGICEEQLSTNVCSLT